MRNDFSSSWLRTGLLLVALALAGCGAQPPKHADTPLPKNSKQAYISTESENNYQVYTNRDRRIYITALDGKSLKEFFASTPWPQELFLEPGKRTISVLYTHEGLQTFKSFTFEAQEGKRYKVRRKLSGYTVQMWVEDDETKTPVPDLGSAK